MGLTVAAVTYSCSLARPDPRIKLSEVSGANILHRVLRKLNLEKQRHRDKDTKRHTETHRQTIKTKELLFQAQR